MRRVITFQLLFRVIFLSLIMVFTTVGPAFPEMTLNDNVNIEGALSLDGENRGIIFVDGFWSQTKAASPPWYQILPGNKRFVVVMNDEAVLDRETGLVWERDTIDNCYTWFEALDYCYSAYIGGRGGWRLPTIAELTTLISTAITNPALPEDHPFTNIQAEDIDEYWSSTTVAGDVSNAWRCGFEMGIIGYDDKLANYRHYIRAVRSGR